MGNTGLKGGDARKLNGNQGNQGNQGYTFCAKRNKKGKGKL